VESAKLGHKKLVWSRMQDTRNSCGAGGGTQVERAELGLKVEPTEKGLRWSLRSLNTRKSRGVCELMS